MNAPQTETLLSPAARPHVLVVDDDARIGDLVARYLKENGFLAMTARDAAAARTLIQRFSFDILVVDVMMPGESGLSLTSDLRRHHQAPVLLLTARAEKEDRIAGLEAGADDYLTKPFEPRELVLRLRAILRRVSSAPLANTPIQIGKWTYDPARGLLTGDAETVKLTDGENILLQALASQPGTPIDRDVLARRCGIPDSAGRAIDVQVTRLRRKLEADSRLPRHLITVRGKGYILRVED